MRTVAMPGKSPLVTFRIVFTTGSAADPADKPGLAYLTAQMIADGGTKDLTYKQVADALFPMAAGVSAQVDKEMTTFGGATHVDNLAEYYKLLRGMLLTPGWREDDFRRVKDDAINAIKVGLRGNNDEELGKEVLYETHLPGDAVRAFERRHGVVAGEDHAGRREGVLQEPVQPVATDYRDRGRVPAGVPGGDEEGLRGAAGDGGPEARVSRRRRRWRNRAR